MTQLSTKYVDISPALDVIDFYILYPELLQYLRTTVPYIDGTLYLVKEGNVCRLYLTHPMTMDEKWPLLQTLRHCHMWNPFYECVHMEKLRRYLIDSLPYFDILARQLPEFDQQNGYTPYDEPAEAFREIEFAILKATCKK